MAKPCTHTYKNKQARTHTNVHTHSNGTVYMHGFQFISFGARLTCDLYFIHILWPEHDEITVHNSNPVTFTVLILTKKGKSQTIDRNRDGMNEKN